MAVSFTFWPSQAVQAKVRQFQNKPVQNEKLFAKSFVCLAEPAIDDAVWRFQIAVVSDLACMQKGHPSHYVINQGYPEIEKEHYF